MASMLCGDETNSTVIDIGTRSCRFGTAGQDSPRHIFRSDIGDLLDAQGGVERGRFVGDMTLRVLRPDKQVRPLASPSAATQAEALSWDDVEAVLRFGFESMRCDAQASPAMFAQGRFFHSRSAQLKLAEICFESLHVPAFFAMPSSVLSAFSAGRTTALVLDCGAGGCSVSPVVDGFELRKASKEFGVGGDAVDEAMARLVEPELLESAIAGAASGQTGFLQDLHPSLRALRTADALRDIKHWMSIIPPPPPERLAWLPPPYILPDGRSVPATPALCTVAESLFFPAANATGSASTNSSTAAPLSLAKCVHEALARADVDSRKMLLTNFLPVGGTSMTSGFVQRLSTDLSTLLPVQFKVKPTVGLPLERLHAAWIGGSVLGICGSFQQLWISRQEFEESGEAILRKRLQY